LELKKIRRKLILNGADSLQSAKSPKISKNGRRHFGQRNSLPPRLCSSTSISPMISKQRRTAEMLELTRKSDSPASYASFCPTHKQINSSSEFSKKSTRSKSIQNISKIDDFRRCNEMKDCSPMAFHPPLNFALKQAKLTSVAEYNDGLLSDEMKQNIGQIKCVNFASKLVTVVEDDQNNEFIPNNDDNSAKMENEQGRMND
jgi:hypothetical protein